MIMVENEMEAIWFSDPDGHHGTIVYHTSGRNWKHF